MAPFTGAGAWPPAAAGAPVPVDAVEAVLALSEPPPHPAARRTGATVAAISAAPAARRRRRRGAGWVETSVCMACGHLFDMAFCSRVGRRPATTPPRSGGPDGARGYS